MTKSIAVIPCHNHAEKLGDVLAEIPKEFEILLIDDGSDEPVKIENTRAKILRFEKNQGKAQALKTAFAFAQENGYTHAITLDADGQHPASMLPDFERALCKNPNAIIVGTRNFNTESVPPARRFMNKFSNFWFKAETGVALADTQCGFRAYPLREINKIRVHARNFTYEVELLVKAAWAGIEFEQIQIPTIYDAESLAKSHYRPFADTARFSIMNARLFFTSLFLSKSTLKKLALKK